MSKEKMPAKLHQNHTPQQGGDFGHVHQAQEQAHHDRDHLGHEKHKAGEIKASEVHAPIPTHRASSEKQGITIYIDSAPYHTASDKFSVADLRNLTVPPIGSDKNIFRVVSGKGDDVQLTESDVIAVDMREANQGRHFFSDTIVPSKDAVARRAYAIYLEHGSKSGHDAENWAEAEAQLDTRAKSQ